MHSSAYSQTMQLSTDNMAPSAVYKLPAPAGASMSMMTSSRPERQGHLTCLMRAYGARVQQMARALSLQLRMQRNGFPGPLPTQDTALSMLLIISPNRWPT